VSPGKVGGAGRTTSTSSRPSTSTSSGRPATSTERIEALTGRKSSKRTAEEEQFGGAPGKAMQRDLKRNARKQDDEAKEQYESGRDDARAEHRAKSADKRKSKVRRQARGKARKVQHAAKAPVKAARSGTVIGLLVGSLGLVLLINFLRASSATAGFLGGLNTAIAWIADPTKVIEYKGGG
jgi:hypothetical protein